MKRLTRLGVGAAAAALLVVAAGCADTDANGSQGANVTDGSDQQLCLSSGGEWVEDWSYCACRSGGLPGTFIPDAGGCVDDAVGEKLCEETGGEWTDDASDSYYCICPVDMMSSSQTGKCEVDPVVQYLTDESGALPSELIHPELGIHAVYSPGFYEVVSHFSDLDALLTKYPFFHETLTSNDCELEEGSPEFSCETQFGEAVGCFGRYVTGYDRMSNSMIVMNALEAQYSEDPLYSDAAIERARAVEAHITRKVVVTKKYADLLFGEVDRRWYLLALDARYSCEE